MTEPTEPTAVFPNSLPVRLWRTRREPPAVTIRCGRGKRRCDRLAYIYETEETAVVVFFQHTPDAPARMQSEIVMQRQAIDGVKSWDGISEVALLKGITDETGTVVCLERDDYWSNIVEVGCRSHLGLLPLSRPVLMDLLRQSRRRGGTLEHSVS